MTLTGALTGARRFGTGRFAGKRVSNARACKAVYTGSIPVGASHGSPATAGFSRGGCGTRSEFGPELVPGTGEAQARRTSLSSSLGPALRQSSGGRPSLPKPTQGHAGGRRDLLDLSLPELKAYADATIKHLGIDMGPPPRIVSFEC
jgi:hypothetical protein